MSVLAAIAAAAVLLSGQITVPNTFVNGTVADAPQVNANFNALASNALNRTGGTMTGTLNARDLIPTADNTYALGSVALKWKLPFIAGGSSGQVLTTDGAGTTSWAAVGSAIAPCNLRLTATSGTPITTADVTAATNVYVSPTAGAQCAFFDGSSTWTLLSSIAEVTVAVPATTSTNYDVFCYNNAGTMACDSALVWTNATTRATALTTQNGVYVKTGATTRRYIGSFRTTGVSGQTEDSAANRFVWSYYNRVDRYLQAALETTDSWAYVTASYRQANANTANQLNVLVGVAEVLLTTEVQAVTVPAAATAVNVAIGEDSTTTQLANQLMGVSVVNGSYGTLLAKVSKYPAVGYHFYAWLEYGAAAATFYGDDGRPTRVQSGIRGTIPG